MVIAIIAILSALAVGASQYVMQKAGVSRAQTEIAAMAAALERYKTDNGDYPVTAPIAASPEYVGTPSSYQANAAVLYASLAGTATYGSAPTNTVYIKFASNQVATNATPQYVKDPFRNAYGFQTAVTSEPVDPEHRGSQRRVRRPLEHGEPDHLHELQPVGDELGRIREAGALGSPAPPPPATLPPSTPGRPSGRGRRFSAWSKNLPGRGPRRPPR